MSIRHTPALRVLAWCIAAAWGLAGAGTALAQTQAAAPAATEAAKPAAGINAYPKRADAAFVKEWATVPPKPGVMLIDSRPTARKYDIGHIPGAVNIPDTQFDKLAPTLLPADKGQLLIFYCDGLECALSHTSAFRAEKLGYTNIRVYAEGFPDWVKNGGLHAISVPQLKKLMDEKAPLVLVDARPKDRKYDKGHIPGALSLPDTQFDKLAATVLPADKATPLVFYCEGLECKLSQDSAARAIKLGYTNVRVLPDGYPGWVKAYGEGAGAAATAAPKIEPGKDKGTISIASFERIFKEAPQSVHLVDVRDPGEFATGSFKGAINMPVSTLEKNIDKLPTGKPIVFFCGAGARSGEAYDMVKLYKPQTDAVFLDAKVKWTPTGEYTIAAN